MMQDLSRALYIEPQMVTGMDHWIAGFSTRHGGISPAPFDSLNLGLSTQDERVNVLANRERLFGPVGVSLDRLAIAGQVHGTRICEVDRPGLYRGFDGLVTRLPGLVLCLSAADCASVLLMDPVARIAGACHAGWRGVVGGIVEKTLALMKSLGADPEVIRAYVSPCISVEHFEVGDEVARLFDSRYVMEGTGERKPHVDLKAAINGQLIAAGVPGKYCEISQYCTVEQGRHFFSYRAEQGKTGRLMGFIGMREKKRNGGTPG